MTRRLTGREIFLRERKMPRLSEDEIAHFNIEALQAIELLRSYGLIVKPRVGMEGLPKPPETQFHDLVE